MLSFELFFLGPSHHLNNKGISRDMGSAAEGQDSRAPACQESKTLAPTMQKQKRPSWPWPCDIEVKMGCWPCPYLSKIWIWSRLNVIRAVKTITFAKIVKHRNDLCNLDFYPMTFRSIWEVARMLIFLKTHIHERFWTAMRQHELARRMISMNK